MYFRLHVGNGDISTFHVFFLAFRLWPPVSTSAKNEPKINIIPNTENQVLRCVFSFCCSESTFECGHFAPRIIKNGSRSSENEAIEVSKYRHAWILLVLLFRWTMSTNIWVCGWGICYWSSVTTVTLQISNQNPLNWKTFRKCFQVPETLSRLQTLFFWLNRRFFDINISQLNSHFPLENSGSMRLDICCWEHARDLPLESQFRTWKYSLRRCAQFFS